MALHKEKAAERMKDAEFEMEEKLKDEKMNVILAKRKHKKDAE